MPAPDTVSKKAVSASSPVARITLGVCSWIPATGSVPRARTRNGSAMNDAPEARSSGPRKNEKMSA